MPRRRRIPPQRSASCSGGRCIESEALEDIGPFRAILHVCPRSSNSGTSLLSRYPSSSQSAGRSFRSVDSPAAYLVTKDTVSQSLSPCLQKAGRSENFSGDPTVCEIPLSELYGSITSGFTL